MVLATGRMASHHVQVRGQVHAEQSSKPGDTRSLNVFASKVPSNFRVSLEQHRLNQAGLLCFLIQRFSTRHQ